MAATVIDTAGWRVVVPIKPALNLTGSHLTCTLTDRNGGAVITLDSAIPVPGYGGNQIAWTADPVTGLSDSLVLTVTLAMRGAWSAAGPNGLPGLVTLFGDVLRTVAGSQQDPEALGRTSFAVMPGTGSPAVAVGLLQPVLTALQGVQSVIASALQVGPQGQPGSVINTYPVTLAQDGQTAIPYPPQSPPLVPSTVHLIVNGEEYFPPDIAVGDAGITWTCPVFSLERSDKLVLRYT